MANNKYLDSEGVTKLSRLIKDNYLPNTSGAVTTAKIADGAVTTAKIANPSNLLLNISNNAVDWFNYGLAARSASNAVSVSNGLPQIQDETMGCLAKNGIFFKERNGGNNDAFWIRTLAYDENSHIVEFATGDDGNIDFGIHFRAYDTSNNITSDLALPKKSGTLATTDDVETAKGSTTSYLISTSYRTLPRGTYLLLPIGGSKNIYINYSYTEDDDVGTQHTSSPYFSTSYYATYLQIDSNSVYKNNSSFISTGGPVWDSLYIKTSSGYAILLKL